MRVGLLTGGGDCPGLNAVIRAVVQRVVNGGGSCVGILEGWRGLVRGMSRELDISETDGIIAKGGTILGSSRTNPFKNADHRHPRAPGQFRGARARRPRGHRRRRYPGRRPSPAQRLSDADGRHPQDDRQRPDGDRLHLRLRHRHQHRDRGGRPPPHDDREPSTDHGRRDDGTPCRLDRLLRRDRGRRRLHPRPRDARSTSPIWSTS